MKNPSAPRYVVAGRRTQTNSPQRYRAVSRAQLLTLLHLLWRHHPAVPVWAGLCSFWGHQLFNSCLERSANCSLGTTVDLKGQEQFTPWVQTAGGSSCTSSCEMGRSFGLFSVVLGVFCVLIFFFFFNSLWDQNLWKLGKLGSEIPFCFCLLANHLTLQSKRSF